jgi:hypothetical protein
MGRGKDEFIEVSSKRKKQDKEREASTGVGPSDKFIRG